MAFRIVFPEYFIDIIVIICQILFVIACHTSYVHYYSIWTLALFSVNSPDMFTIYSDRHACVCTDCTHLKITRYYDGSCTMSASISDVS